MIVRGKHFATGHVVDLHINTSDGRIGAVTTPGPAEEVDWGSGKELIAPGFFDIQVNGFAGVDFQSPNLTADDLLHATREQQRHGVTQFLATVISGSYEQMFGSFRALARALDHKPALAKSVTGFHQEGPYLCTSDGPRGAHPKHAIRPPSWEEFQQFQEAAGGRIKMITLSPEWTGVIHFIESVVKTGVVVAIGHTSASVQQLEEAVSAGAKISTHLGNGAHAVLPRHDNYIQQQLANDSLMASFIADGHHLPPYVVKNFLRAKGLDRSILTTDAMSAAGAGPGRYRIGNIETEVGSDGKVRLQNTPFLAGSAATLENCVTNAMAWTGIDLTAALKLVTENPRRLLNQSSGLLETGAPADLILFNYRDGQIHVKEAFVGGQAVFSEQKNRSPKKTVK